MKKIKISENVPIQSTLVIPCRCSNEWQDHFYGTGNRVHNLAAKTGPGKSKAYRCTVCSNVKSG